MGASASSAAAPSASGAVADASDPPLDAASDPPPPPPPPPSAAPSSSPCPPVAPPRVVEDVLSPAEHDRVVAWVRATLAEGRAGALPGSTYAPIPDKWRARNQSREMLQFGAYTHSNRVEAHVPVAPLEGTPLERVVDALVLAGCFEGAAFERPNACTVNVYRPGQWIPPHVDNPAFERPFVTVSLVSRQPMLVGRGVAWPYAGSPDDAEDTSPLDADPVTNDTGDVACERSSLTDGLDRLRSIPGVEIVVPLPVSSAVVMTGAVADAREHAVPPVSAERISLTFRRLAGTDDASARRTRERTERTERARAEMRELRRRREEEEGEEKKGSDANRAANRASASESASASDPSASAALPPASKSRRKKEAKKAARRDAKAARLAARAGASGGAPQNVNPPRSKVSVLSADGVTALEVKAKRRPCPACPPAVLRGDEGVGPEAVGPEEGPEKTPEGTIGGASSRAGIVAKTDASREPSSSDGRTPFPEDGSRDVRATTSYGMPRVERQCVMDVYDAVAAQWHGTRYRAWSGVEDFARRRVPDFALVADVGCGNGKNAPAIERIPPARDDDEPVGGGESRATTKKGGGGAHRVVIGCDFSLGLLEICALRRDPPLEVFAADATALPSRSRAFDAALCVAVLHHASTDARRRAIVGETMRIVRPGGVALFYAWAYEQDRGGVSGHAFESQDVLVPFHERAPGPGASGESVVSVGVSKETFAAGGRSEEAGAGAGAGAGRGGKDGTTTDASRGPKKTVEGGGEIGGRGERGEAGGGDADANGTTTREGAGKKRGGGRVFQRYCHVYREGELEALFAPLAGWVRVDRAYYDCGNWCVEATRIE